MSLFMMGATAMAAGTAGLFFLHFWRKTRDRLFLMFAIAFWLEAIQRALLALSPKPNEGDPLLYAVRLLAYAIIVVAILDKNVNRTRRG